jgi:hypothetical protein
VSPERFRGVRVYDVSDVEHPRQVAAVQTCRGSHTHTLVPDPADDSHVYIYVSGTSQVRPGEELAGCTAANPAEDPNSALFRIEVIEVPLDHPEQAAIVNSPHFLLGLAPPPVHGVAPHDRIAAAAEAAAARERGQFVVVQDGAVIALPENMVVDILGQIVAARGGEGAATAADSAALWVALDQQVGQNEAGEPQGPDQCHDITVYPEVGLGAGACSGYGILLDLSDPARPTRVGAVADSNFAYWHSATFSNDGRTVLFTDEWGGGMAPRCRATDRPEWGADALFTIEGHEMRFASYYKLPAATSWPRPGTRVARRSSTSRTRPTRSR